VPNRVLEATFRDFETIELYFTQSDNIHSPKELRRLVAQNVRVVIGYLSRVCPTLRKVKLGLDRGPLNLRSDLCIASRLKRLEELTIEMPWKSCRRSSGLDLSWLDPPQFLEVTTLFHKWEMSGWGLLPQREQELIQLTKSVFGAGCDHVCWPDE